MIKVSQKGNLSKTYNFLNDIKTMDFLKRLDDYGRQGVRALSEATPVDSGKTAESWSYKIEKKGSTLTISWFNSNIEDGVPIAILLQYGHATSNGGFVQGRNYINPAIQPIFDRIADSAWKEVVRL